MKLTDDNNDKTREVREAIADAENLIEFEGIAKTHGMLPEDLEKQYYNPVGQSYGKIGDVGAGKILPIHNRKDLTIKGGEFYNPEYAFTNENRPTRRHHNVSELSFLDLDNCDNVTIEDLKFTGPHTEVREKTGYPSFHSSREFAHGIDIRNSENVLFKNLKFKNVPGDFVYFRKGGERPNKNVSIIDCEIDFNGRQGVAWGDGQNVYIDNLRVVLSGRGGVDIEPPKHGYEANNVIVRNSYFNTWLLPMPMGGLGTIRNVLIENNEWKTTSLNTYVLADKVNSFRENIIFRGNKRLSGYGSGTACYVFKSTDNILIENEYAALKDRRSYIVIQLDNCRNVTIRNNDFPNAKYIMLRDTPIEEVKVYGNKQDLQFMVYETEGEYIDAPDLKDFAEYGRDDWSMWSAAVEEWKAWYGERYANAEVKYVPVEEYDVEKYGEPDVPKDPDFTPYMGVEEEPEPPKEEPPVVDPTPEPDPEDPIEPPKEEPTPEVPEEKPIYKKTWFIAAAIAVILILTALIIT